MVPGAKALSRRIARLLQNSLTARPMEAEQATAKQQNQQAHLRTADRRPKLPPPSGTTGTPAPSGEEQKGENETLTPLPTPVSGGEAKEGEGSTTPTEGEGGSGSESESVVEVPEDKLVFNNGEISSIDSDWLTKNEGNSLKVVIPAEINGTTVTSIGEHAFQGKNVFTRPQIILAEIDFSNATNLEKIENQAFTGCEKLT